MASVKAGNSSSMSTAISAAQQERQQQQPSASEGGQKRQRVDEGNDTQQGNIEAHVCASIIYVRTYLHTAGVPRSSVFREGDQAFASSDFSMATVIHPSTSLTHHYRFSFSNR